MAAPPTRKLVFAEQASTSAEPSEQPTRPSYSLLALPPALVALLSDPLTASSLEIRGHATDAAVLVSETQTYTIRGVQNSNSILLCSSGSRTGFGEEEQEGDREDEEGEDLHRSKRTRREDVVEIKGLLHETLEVLQGVARTDRLEGLLRGTEYIGEDEEATQAEAGRPFVTFSHLQSVLPACDSAIHKALRNHRVITLDSHLRPIPTSYLLKILPVLLSSLASEAPPDLDDSESQKVAANGGNKKGKQVKEAKPIVVKTLELQVNYEDMISALDSMECGVDAAGSILAWFGEPVKEDGGKSWKLRVHDVVREVGVVALAEGGYSPQPLAPFVAKWKSLCSSFAPLCVLPLLSGTHLVGSALPPMITYFPVSRLSADPATRFNELFAVKQTWGDVEMTEFLDDLVGGDKKKREAMVLKFVRKVKEADGSTSWTARNLW